MDRNNILEEGINRCLHEMYKRAQPSINWYKILKETKQGKLNRKDNFIYHHYLHPDEYKDILEEYIGAYRADNEWKSNIQLVYDYLKNGGTKVVYKSKDSKDYEKTSKLADVIGEENANKVFELLKDCEDFYRGGTDEFYFKFNVMNYSPTSNKEEVQNYYTKQGKNTIIYDRVIDPYTYEWVSVTPKQIKLWKYYIKECIKDDYCIKKIQKLIDEYEQKNNNNS